MMKAGNGAISRIALIGFMASGKTTAGRILAKRLGWDFVDLDGEIEASASMSVPAIFAAEGEEGFRAREAMALAAVSIRERVVLSCGGGTAIAPANREILKFQFSVIWLKVSAETVISRSARETGTRPLLDCPDPEARIRELLSRRKEAYESCAHLVIESDRDDPETIAEKIHDSIGISL